MRRTFSMGTAICLLGHCLLAAGAAAQETEGEQPPADAETYEPESAAEAPGRTKPVPGITAHFAKAQLLPVNQVTDIRLTPGEVWFRINLDAPAQVVLRVAALNAWSRAIRVYDASGAPYFAGFQRANRPTAWHGLVSRGAYFVSLGPKSIGEETRKELSAEELQALKDAHPPAENTPGGRPAMLVMVDPVGPGATPRQAAQLSLDYLEIDVPAWQNEALCNGCHMQSQALMGMAIAKRNGYRVEERSALSLGEFLIASPIDEGPGLLFTGLGLKHYVAGFAPARKEALLGGAGKLASLGPPDEPFDSGPRVPVEDGVLTGSAMAAEILAAAGRLAPAKAPSYRRALERALSDVRGAEANTVQDQVMRLIAASETGEKLTPASAAVVALLKMQNADGGFGEKPGGGPSNAYGTGQALYGLRLAGVSADAPAHRRAVEWLMDHQIWNGSWPLIETECLSDITHAMWATIGLAGSVEAKPGRLAVVGDTQGTAAPRFELILDASGSMRRKLGGKTMLELAKSSLGQVIDKLPQGAEIALRAYGHRVREGHKGDCEDSELVSPFAPLDRAALMAKVATIKALGTTPIAFSLARAGDDLREGPGEKMLVLLTDGKEECKGDPVAAVEGLQKQGLKLRLNVVGFALNDPGAKQQMRRAAELTGGRFFDARDAEGLKRAIGEALARPFELLDATGARVGGGASGGDPVEVRPGTYSITLQRDGQQLKASGIKIQAGKLTRVVVKGKAGAASLEVKAPVADQGP